MPRWRMAAAWAWIRSDEVGTTASGRTARIIRLTGEGGGGPWKLWARSKLVGSIADTV